MDILTTDLNSWKYTHNRGNLFLDSNVMHNKKNNEQLNHTKFDFVEITQLIINLYFCSYHFRTNRSFKAINYK